MNYGNTVSSSSKYRNTRQKNTQYRDTGNLQSPIMEPEKIEQRKTL